MINFKNLTFNYNDKEESTLKSINLNIDSGIWTVEGNNGSGKTTFLNLING